MFVLDNVSYTFINLLFVRALNIVAIYFLEILDKIHEGSTLLVLIRYLVFSHFPTTVMALPYNLQKLKCSSNHYLVSSCILFFNCSFPSLNLIILFPSQ